LSAVSAGSSSQDPAGKRVKKDVDDGESESPPGSADSFGMLLLEAIEETAGEDPSALNEVLAATEKDQEQVQQAGGEQSNEDTNLPEYLKKYQPAHEYIFQPEDADYGTFYASAEFQADPCPVELRYSGLDDSNFSWEKIEEFSFRGEPGVYSDGKPKRLRARKEGDIGQHISGLNFERVSATEKYLQWREQILSRPDHHANKRKPRKITLEECE
jgi:hypothetical protein